MSLFPYNRNHMLALCCRAFRLSLFLFPLCLYAAKKPITLRDLATAAPRFRAPSPIWQPGGKMFAYEEKGKLWLYDVPARRAKIWLSLEDLDKSVKTGEKAASPPAPFNWQNRRVNTSGPQWSRNGRLMLVPTASASFVMETGKSKPRNVLPEINENHVPTLSPDGQSVLFRRESNLFVFDLESKKTVQLTFDGSPTLLNGKLDWVYPEELDLGTAFWWSPDSKRIAYLQFNTGDELIYPHEDLLKERAVYEPQRYPQAGTPNALVKVGVVSAFGGNTAWMDLGPNKNVLIARVNWLPDSSRLAIQRLNRVQDRLDLLAADSNSGQTTTLLSEQDQYWVNTHDDLCFLHNVSQFLWSSERTGFRHLYLYSTEGRQLKQLTSGNWQVNRVIAVNEARRLVYFTSTQAGPLEEQLYSVSLDGGNPQRLSQQPGVHDIRADEEAGNYLDVFSNPTTPPSVTLHDDSGKELAVMQKPDRTEADRFEILPTEIVTLKADDGTLLYARLIKPAQFNPTRKYPAIVFVYGGPHAQAVRNLWSGLSWEQALAHRGFAVWQVDNRGSFGRGHRFESPVYREFGKVELSDQRAGVQKLLSLGFVDPARVGIYGWSFGGYMTLYSLLHAPDVFKVGVAGAPVTDWHNYDTIYTERYMGLPDQNAEGYRKSSNVLAADQLQGKLMIVCNFEDDNVLFQNTMQMMNALHRSNKEFDFMLYPQKTHGVTGTLSEGMRRQMTDFLIANLQP